jgi:pimeloyl-ACP methyl ester carboxylesterase
MGMTPSEAAELFRRPPDRFVPTPAGDAACRSIGSGPGVLLVHGWPVTGATFRTLLPFVADHVTCHVVDLPGAGDSRFDETTPVSIANHVRAVRAVVDALGLAEVAVVGHDSGGLIARHAFAGDGRLRALALIDSEQTGTPGWRFRSFVAARRLPGHAAVLGWVAGRRRLRRSSLLLGGAFVDRDLLDGEFDEFFLAPLRHSPRHRRAATRLLCSFDYSLVRTLPALHRRIAVPVALVWGAHDPFFPVAGARELAASFPRATLDVVEGGALFAHEERPSEVARALLPLLTTA